MKINIETGTPKKYFSQSKYFILTLTYRGLKSNTTNYEANKKYDV